MCTTLHSFCKIQQNITEFKMLVSNIQIGQKTINSFNNNDRNKKTVTLAEKLLSSSVFQSVLLFQIITLLNFSIIFADNYAFIHLAST